VEDAHPTACIACEPLMVIGVDQLLPFHTTASAPPRHTAMQKDVPEHESDGLPVAPDAAPVATGPDQAPAA